MRISHYFIALSAAALLGFTSCKKKDNPAPATNTGTGTVNTNTITPTNTTTPTNTLLPVIATSSVINITDSTAVSGGTVSSEGASAISMVGVCWDTQPAPTTLKPHTSNGAGTGNYVSNITGLQVNTTYYVRAYATNFNGTAYGNEITFSTPAVELWHKSTVAALNSITLTCMISDGNNIYAGTENGVILSGDNGDTWSSGGLTTNHIITLAQSNGNLYAIASSGGTYILYRSGDNGGSWQTVVFPSAVTSVYDIDAGDNLWATTNNGAYYSTTGGDSWVYASSGVPAPGSFGGMGGGIGSLETLGSAVYGFSTGWNGSSFYRQLYTFNGNSWSTSNMSLGTNDYLYGFKGCGSTFFMSYTSTGLYRARYLNNGSWLPLNGVPETAAYSFGVSESTILASAGAYLAVSSNSGASWSRIQKLGLPTGTNGPSFISKKYIWTHMPDGLYRYKYN